jgi:hypothetical protein
MGIKTKEIIPINKAASVADGWPILSAFFAEGWGIKQKG